MTGVKAFCWFFVGIGAVAFCIGAKLAFQSFRCISWPTTEGIIRSATMGRHRSNKGGTTYSADISYDYTVAGSRYTGTELAFGTMSASARYAGDVLGRYPIGAKVTVHYSPNAPETAVLETGIHGGTWICLGVGGVFALFGIAFLQMLKRQPVPNQTAPTETTGSRPSKAPKILFGAIPVVAGISAIIAGTTAGDNQMIISAVGATFCLAGLYIMLSRPVENLLLKFIKVVMSLLMLGVFNWLVFGSRVFGSGEVDGFSAFVIGVVDLAFLAVAAGWLVKRLKRHSYSR